MINDASAQKRLLILMPMLPEYKAVREVVARTVVEMKLGLVWLDELLEDWQWLDWLYTSVQQCDLILANPSQHNAYVMYEIGVARTNMRPTLLMLDHEDSWLSGSLDGSSFLPYSNTMLNELSSNLRANLSILAGVTIAQDKQIRDFTKYYSDAVLLLNGICDESGQNIESVDKGAFTVRLTHSINHGTFTPELIGTPLGNTALLAALIRSSRTVSTMSTIQKWVWRTHTQ